LICIGSQTIIKDKKKMAVARSRGPPDLNGTRREPHAGGGFLRPESNGYMGRSGGVPEGRVTIVRQR